MGGCDNALTQDWLTDSTLKMKCHGNTQMQARRQAANTGPQVKPIMVTTFDSLSPGFKEAQELHETPQRRMPDLGFAVASYET